MAEPCTIEGCETKRYGRGWCEKHYTRWRRNGDPNVTQRYRDPADALAARTKRTGDCAVWTGATNNGGYGLILVDGASRAAHRVAWELANGPIPDGLFIDHACWNRACVNVEHLRLATRQQNNSNLGTARPGRTLPRNVSMDGNGFRVRVKKNGLVYEAGRFTDLAAATRAAADKRAELFGAFAGR